MKRTARIPAATTTRTGRVPFCTAPATAPDLNATPAPGSALQAATDRVRTLAATEITAHPDQLTANVRIWGGTSITIPEPAWCTGQHGLNHKHGDHPEDLAHTSAETAVTVTRPSGETETLLSAWIASNPFSSDQPEPRATIALPSGDIEDLDEAGLDRLAAELHSAARFIEQLRNQLTTTKQAGR